MTRTNGTSVASRSTLSSRARSFMGGCLFIFGLAAASIAHAKIFNVNSTADAVDVQPGDGVCETVVGNGVCTLRAAIQEANANGSTDTINLPVGEYILNIPGAGENRAATGDLDISESLSIVGIGGSPDQVIINGNGSILNDRVLHILGGATVSLSNLTVKGGHVRSTVGGGIYLESGNLTIDNCTISDNTAWNPDAIVDGGNGGGIYVTTTSTLLIKNSTLTRNTSDTNSKGIGGGAIFNNGALRIEDTTFDANSAVNSPSAAGGALQNQGGTGLDPNVARVILVRNSFTRNNANIGGAIRNLYGAIIMDGGTISNNQANSSGGGIENSGGNMIIGHVSIHDNNANQTGGGISNFDALDLSYSAVYSNTVSQALNGQAGQGGGIYNSGQGRLSLLNTTITLNAGQEGGGIYNHRAANITNSTIYNNTSTKNGSELVACGSKNEGVQGQDCSFDSSHVDTQIVNTIIGNSSGAVACVFAPIPTTSPQKLTITSKGHNIDTGSSCGFNQTGDQSNIPVSQLFVGPAANNGGLTLNYAILPNSPAQNTGDNSNCPIIDQRDYNRNDGACDIGAYEISTSQNHGAQLVDLKVDVTSNASTQGGGGQVTFTITVTNKGPSQATNVILTGQLPPWAMPQANSITNNNGGTCSLTSTGFTCNLGAINAYASAQVYVVVFPKQAGTVVLDVEAHSDQVETFRPNSTTSNVATVNPVTPTGAGGPNGVAGTFSGKSGSVDWSWGLLLLIPLLRRYARRS